MSWNNFGVASIPIALAPPTMAVACVQQHSTVRLSWFKAPPGLACVAEDLRPAFPVRPGPSALLAPWLGSTVPGQSMSSP